VHRRTRAVLLSCSVVSVVGAVVVFITGVILTSGAYGSRMAWLLGVVLPLLLLAALFAWLACRPARPNVVKVVTSSRLRHVSAIMLLVVGFLFLIMTVLAAFHYLRRGGGSGGSGLHRQRSSPFLVGRVSRHAECSSW